jgi:hypothetical protein
MDLDRFSMNHEYFKIIKINPESDSITKDKLMKTRITLLSILLLVFAVTNSFGQHLNKYGRFISAELDPVSYKVNIDSGYSRVEIENHLLKGNSVFKTQNGYITLSGNYENAPSVLRIYSKEGNEIFAQSFRQTINFVLSPAKNFCAFHDMKQICLVNLLNNEVSTFPYSNVFALNDAGELASYDEVTSSLIFKNKSVMINEPVYKVLFFNEEPLFITKLNILKIKNESAKKTFNSLEGRVFDAAIFNEKLYISVKKEMPGEFIFKSFSTDNLIQYKEEQEVHFPLQSHLKKRIEKTPSQNKMSSIPNESILDPLAYYNDTVYRQVGNSYCEMQEYSPGAMYPHPGVDLLDTFMRDVYSVKKGFVKAIITTSGAFHWRIAISNQNTANYTQGYLYAHLEQSSFPYAVGDSVNEGDIIGYLANFPVTGFVHVHFARIACQGTTWSGNWWTFDNPLSYMSNFFDTIAPEFEKTINNDAFAFRDENGNYLSPDSLYGSVKVISKVFDRINSNWHCDVNKLSYSLSPLAFPQTMLLDSFAYEYNFFDDTYFSGTYYWGLLRTIYSRDVTCFSTANYNVRDFYHIITNSDGNDTIDGADSLQVFNTIGFANDSYIFRVKASDPSGNTTIDSMIVQIKNGANGLNSFSLNSAIKIMPNPFSYSTTVETSTILNNATLTIYNVHGQLINEVKNISGKSFTLFRDKLPSGLYFLRITEYNEIVATEKLVITDN